MGTETVTLANLLQSWTRLQFTPTTKLGLKVTRGN